MPNWSKLLGAGVAGTICLLLLGRAGTGPQQVSSPSQANVAGVAVVIASDRAPDAKLPSAREMEADSGRVTQGFRDAGLCVLVHPTGRCLAVAAPAHVTDEALMAGNLADAALVAGILERLTPEQFAARKKGYLPAEALSPVQLAAERRIAERQGLINKQGEPTDPGTSLHLGVWPTWLVHVSTLQDGKPVSQKLDLGIRPPTAVAVIAAPLAGSVLWWAWSHRDADWGDGNVSVAPGTYTLGDLSNRLSESGEMKITAHPQVRENHFAVVASQVPLKKLLWAIAAASGLQVRVSGDSETPTILLTSEVSRQESYNAEKNLLLPIPGFGYYSSSDSAIGQELLSSLEGGPTTEGVNWVGWRFSDMPLLYRTSIEDEWQRTNKIFQRKADPLEPEHTYVLWSKAVLVSVVLNRPDGSGGGPEFPLPAF